MASPDLWEDKYVPSSSSETTVEEKEGMAKALKKLVERKFVTFEKEMIRILERKYHEEEDSNMVKEKKKETETCTNKYEESICWLESGKRNKKKQRTEGH